MVKLPSFSPRVLSLFKSDNAPTEHQNEIAETLDPLMSGPLPPSENIAESKLDNLRSEMPDYGRIEAFDGNHMSGWYFNIEQKTRSLSVILDDKILCGAIANLPRSDVSNATKMRVIDKCGFYIDLHEFNILKKCENLEGLYKRLKVSTGSGRYLAHCYDNPYHVSASTEGKAVVDSNFDGLDSGRVTGWLVIPSRVSPAVHIFIDGIFQGAAFPCEYRKDVGDIYGDYSCGFAFPLSSKFQDGMSHLIRCFVAETGEELNGSPKDLVIISNDIVQSNNMRILSQHYTNAQMELAQIREQMGRLAFTSGAYLINYPAYQEIVKPANATLAFLSKKSAINVSLISIVMPTFKSNLSVLSKAINSIQDQTDQHWELVISDSLSCPGPLMDYLNAKTKEDARIRVIFNEASLGISDNTNVALRAAGGDFVCFMDHDDELAPEALSLNRSAFASGKYDIVYSDEDKISLLGEYVEPHYKPAFDYDLILSMNYICHLLFVRKSSLMKTELLRSRFDGAQDWDLILQLLKDVPPDRIGHIPRVLYHWRMAPGSTALAAGEKDYAVDSGLRAVQNYLLAGKIPATAARSQKIPYVDVTWATPPNVLVSVIIPTKDRIDLVTNCINSFQKTAAAVNYEILIVDNDSSRATTPAFERMIDKDKRIRVIKFSGAFNYSAINNFAAKSANGDYFLLLNNDVFFLEANWLETMLGIADRKDVGVVGIKLLYPDNTIQHCGVVLGNGGVAGHAFSHLASTEHGYFARASCNHQVSAVTAACLLVKAETFWKVGGLDEEELTVAFNDVDFCMKVQGQLLSNVLVCTTSAYHAESISRGQENSIEKIARFQAEVMTMKKRWGHKLYQDRFYSPNFDLNHDNYSQIDLRAIAKQETEILEHTIVR